MKSNRFYKNILPQEGDIVYVQTVNNRQEIFDIIVLDYDNIEGYISLSNMTRRTKNKQFKVIGQQYPALVLSSDDTGLMLSKIKIQFNDIPLHKEHYEIAKKITSYGHTIYEFYKLYLKKNNLSYPYTVNGDSDSDGLFNFVMENTVWRYYESLDGRLLTNDDMVYIVRNFNILVNTPVFSDDFQKEFMMFLEAHTERTLMELRTVVEIICYASNATSEIKKILSHNYSDNYDFDVAVRMQSPPLYFITATGLIQKNIESHLDKCVADIKSRVDTSTTKFKIVDDKKVIKNDNVTLVALSTQEILKWFNEELT